MPLAIVYCDRCARLIRPGEIEQQKARITDGGALCPACLEAMPPGERAAVVAPAAPSGRQPRPRPQSTRSRAGAPAGASRSGGRIIYAGLGLGVLAGLAVGVVISRQDAPAPAPEDMTARDAEASSAAASARLEEVRAWRDPELERYADMRLALVALSGDFPAAPAARAALGLLEEIDREHAEIAERAWANSEGLVEAQISSGAPGPAEWELDTFVERFKETPWFEERGEDLVAELRAKIGRLRAGAAVADAADVAATEAAPGRRESSVEPPDGARWIWFPEGDPAAKALPVTRYFRWRVALPADAGVASARFYVTADNSCTVSLNGVPAVAKISEWKGIESFDVARFLRRGENVLAISARNADGPAGVVAWLEAALEDGTRVVSATDGALKASAVAEDGWERPGFDDAAWPAARELGPVGMAPWGGGLVGIPDDLRPEPSVSTPRAPREAGAADVASGLVGWWKFDEAEGSVIKDHSGKGFDGELRAGKWRPGGGKHGGALASSGDAPASASFPGPAGPMRTFSVAFWLRPASLVDYNQNVGATGGWGKFRFHAGAGGKVWCGIDGKPEARFEHYDTGPAPVETGRWQHFVFTYEGGPSRFYRDGRPVATKTLPAPSDWPGFEVTDIDGEIDDLRIYDRPVTHAEVCRLAGVDPASVAAPMTVTQGLVGWWKLDEGSGGSVSDSSGGRNDGKLVGGARWTAGQSGGALAFDGKSTRVELGKGVGSAAALTVAFWMRADKLAYQIPVDKHPAGKGGKGWTVKLRTDGGVWFRVGSDETRADFQVPAAYAPGAWVHVAFSYEKGTASAYIDGMPRGVASVGRAVNDTATPLWLGAPSAATKNEIFSGALDDVRVYDRALSAEEVRSIGLEPVAWLLDRGLRPEHLTGDPARDGYRLSPALFRELCGRFQAGKVTARKIAAAGDNLAASASFDAGLRKDLTLADGYVFERGSRLARAGRTAAQLKDILASALERERPEVVRVCVGLTDLVAGTDVGAYRASLDAMVEAVVAQGAVPVLFTLPVVSFEPSAEEAKRQTVKALKDFSDRAEAYSRAVREVASRRQVPCVDAHAIVNADPAARARCFDARGVLRAAGYELVNERFLKLYRILERAVLGRGPAPGAAGGAVAAADATGLPGNVLPNGGFEEKNDEHFATGWSKEQWGERGKGSSVRLDLSNPHCGENALAVRALEEGSRPGAAARLRLAPGTYEVRFWACAGAGESATVGAHFGGRDLPERTATEKWTQFTETVEVEKKNLAATLGLWVSTPRVRVWFDDVELVRK